MSAALSTWCGGSWGGGHSTPCSGASDTGWSDGISWIGHVNTALIHSKAELLTCAPLWMRAALPEVMQCWGQEERTWHHTANHGKIQHFHFKTYKLNNLC